MAHVINSGSRKVSYFNYWVNQFLHCLLMPLFLLSNGLNATYLNLNNIGIPVINAYLANLMYAVTFYFLEQLSITRCMIIISGDIEANTGPKRNSCQSQKFSVCHWNLTLIRLGFLRIDWPPFIFQEELIQYQYNNQLLNNLFRVGWK